MLLLLLHLLHPAGVAKPPFSQLQLTSRPKVVAMKGAVVAMTAWLATAAALLLVLVVVQHQTMRSPKRVCLKCLVGLQHSRGDPTAPQEPPQVLKILQEGLGRGAS
jgi:hypothetical protein